MYLYKKVLPNLTPIMFEFLWQWSVILKRFLATSYPLIHQLRTIDIDFTIDCRCTCSWNWQLLIAFDAMGLVAWWTVAGTISTFVTLLVFSLSLSLSLSLPPAAVAELATEIVRKWKWLKFLSFSYCWHLFGYPCCLLPPHLQLHSLTCLSCGMWCVPAVSWNSLTQL